MNYLLFQPATLSEPDRVYLNGELIEDSLKRSEVYDKIVSIFKKTNSSGYPWFGKSGAYYVLRGLFESKDELGRTLSFLFASDGQDFIDELSSISKTVGYKVDAQTMSTIDGFSTQSSNKKSMFLCISLAIILVLLIIIILLLCNTHQTC